MADIKKLYRPYTNALTGQKNIIAQMDENKKAAAPSPKTGGAARRAAATEGAREKAARRTIRKRK